MDCGYSVSGNPKNPDVSAHCGVIAGDAHANARAGVFAEGKVGGPVTTGVYGGLNANGHGLSVQHAHTPGGPTSTTTSAHATVFQNDKHMLGVNASHAHIKPQNFSSFDKVGGGLNLQTSAGHGAGLGVSHIPQFNMTTMNATGQANLWSSANGASSLDATAHGTRHLSGPFKGHNDFGGGLSFRHKF